MRNLGPGTEARWGLQPGKTYSIWLSEALNGTTLYTIKGPGVKVVDEYHGCGYHAATTSKANFGSCAENRLSATSATGGNAGSHGPSEAGTGKEGHILLDRASGPAWVSCNEGCCTTDAT